MSIWYPASGLTFVQYLQANSFVRDITGQVRSSSKGLEARVTDDTIAVVASNQQLSEEFGRGFNSFERTLEWGFDRLETVLRDVDASIDSLHADFNYSMGLLLEALQIQNGLLTDLLDKLDAINKILERPTLTLAREFYNRGCDRLTKGLLDKALEAFKEAETKNDTDFFTQFHIGKLYLYGVDGDNNILDLQQAKKHLLLASRYAKAEIGVDTKFARLAAEALLHASIAVYAQLGEKNTVGDAGHTKGLLEEGKRLASEAARLAPRLTEAFYHSAKFSVLLDEPLLAIASLEIAIKVDRRYAVKVDVDHAFDSIRPQVLTLLSKLRDGKKSECQQKLKQVSELFGEVSLWQLDKSNVLASQFLKCKQELSKAQSHFDLQTYYGFLDGILLLDELLVVLPQLKKDRIEGLEMTIGHLIAFARSKLPEAGKYSLSVWKAVQETKNLISKAEQQLNQKTYEGYISALSFGNSAKQGAASAHERCLEEDEVKRKAADLQAKRGEWSKEYALMGAVILGLIGGLGGCVDCITHLNKPTTSVLNLITGAILGAVIGFIGGAVIGTVRK